MCERSRLKSRRVDVVYQFFPERSPSAAQVTHALSPTIQRSYHSWTFPDLPASIVELAIPGGAGMGSIDNLSALPVIKVCSRCCVLFNRENPLLQASGPMGES